MIGSTISHYRVLGTAGVGGMGIVYLAQDTQLNRKVALKFLPPAIAQDPQARGRFLREAQAASALDHPNVATIYEIGEWDHQLFIAMAFYEGETLRQRLERGPVPVPEAVSILLHLATGLVAAHHAGIVHRDLKPANVMLTHDGQVKILDFGLAKMVSDAEMTAERMTGPGTTIGTVAYMAPEQARGAEVDARADIWALGVIGYQMLTGRLPFKAENAAAALLSVITDVPAPIRDLRLDVPEEIAALVTSALEKARDRRTITADGIVAALSSWQVHSSAAHVTGRPSAAPSRRWLFAAAALLIAIAVPFAWFIYRASRARWARESAIPEIERLVEHEQFVAAFTLANEAKRYIGTDPVWTRLDPLVSYAVSIPTTPPGALVSYREYGASNATWTVVGRSPVINARVPNTFLIFKVEAPGLVAAEDVVGGPPLGKPMAFTLHTAATTPPGMVYATAGDDPFPLYIPGFEHLPGVKLRDFWIDRFEVSNREFKSFVDAGGYRNRAFWEHPFVKDRRTLSFEEAIATFTDSTGRPGPATWELGQYPEGRDDFPVTGVSWYEASAYAKYAGKSLPTIYHWSRVAEQPFSGWIVPRSNFGGSGPAKVGASGAMTRFGAFDLAGNVKEWCSNRADATRRYILGGAWDEQVYMFNDPDARSPFDRADNFGFRGVKYSPDESLANAGAELVAFEARDFATETPVNDQTFTLFRRIYAYDKTDLKPAVESVDESSNPEWRAEKVSFAAAYGGERIPAFLFLPKGFTPPYQAVVYFPGAGAIHQRSSIEIRTKTFDWILKSGRAVIYPIFKGTHERSDPGLISDNPNQTNAYREHVISWAKDVSRSIDYLETRPEIATDRIAFMGVSWGAAMGPVYLALEPRLKAGALILGGFYVQRSAPEVDAFNFASRVHVPVLLLNGRFDFFYPMDTAQLPMFKLFGVPEEQKRRVIYDTGHNIPRPEMVRETLDWLDRYLGPVQ